MRLTSDNDSKDVYLPYKSSEQTVREAIEEHESRFVKLGWLSVGVMFLLLFLHDTLLFYVFKSL